MNTKNKIKILNKESFYINNGRPFQRTEMIIDLLLMTLSFQYNSAFIFPCLYLMSDSIKKDEKIIKNTFKTIDKFILESNKKDFDFVFIDTFSSYDNNEKNKLINVCNNKKIILIRSN